MPGTQTRDMKTRLLIALAGSILLLSACSPARTTLSPAQEVRPSETVAPLQMTSTATPAGTATPTATADAAANAATAPVVPTATPAFAFCSPLADVTLAEITQPDLLKNPFQLPRPGMDDGHFGADFAYWSRGEHKQMLGLPVLSALNGRVAGLIQNRMPYGNAVIIETPLQAVPAGWLAAVPTPAPTVPPAPNLVCPPDPSRYPTSSARSLYLLYAHLDKAPLVSLEQAVTCGQPIGEVGTTGRSVNPHLHLETRVGPTGVTFAEMAHYDNAATADEMGAYCTWRVSGLFQAFDPVNILSLQP